jgi:hypothetical protein
MLVARARRLGPGLRQDTIECGEVGPPGAFAKVRLRAQRRGLLCDRDINELVDGPN